jgi:hypothetical protein
MPRHFSARPPEYIGVPEQRPLFVEMSFIDLRAASASRSPPAS